MFILVIEDEKEEKLGLFLDYLKTSKDIKYFLAEDEKSAKEFISQNSSKIDGIITDLGLPFDKNSEDNKYNPFSGIEIIDCMAVRNRRIPVIINSAAELDEVAKRRIYDIEYECIENLAEKCAMNPLAAKKIIEKMEGKAIRVDETQVVQETTSKSKTRDIRWKYYMNLGD